MTLFETVYCVSTLFAAGLVGFLAAAAQNALSDDDGEKREEN